MSFAEQIAELKFMIELMNRKKISPDLGNFLISQHFPKSPHHVTGPLGGLGLPGGLTGLGPKLGDDVP